MRFVRHRVEPLSRETVRSLAAREGWLIDSGDVLRAGVGGPATKLSLTDGTNLEVAQYLKSFVLEGDPGIRGTGVVAFGTLPFDRDAPAELCVPEHVITITSDATWVTSLDDSSEWRKLIAATTEPIQEPLGVRTLTMSPSPDLYSHLVAKAVERLRNKELVKVVLARSVEGELDDVIDAGALAQRLRHREPACTIYSLPTLDSRRFVGASPELLIRRTQSEVESHPLAGTVALPSKSDIDDFGTWLLGSAKNLHEHAVLVDEIVRQLAESFDDVRADSEPSIVMLRTVAHLGTWIHATNSPQPPLDALDVVRLIHPTPAVGGLPRELARELIRELETKDRGHYAGPVGWLDQDGDGDWWLGIRGVLVEGDHFEAWAGAGIVSESDPLGEREETRDKLQSVLGSLLVSRF